MPNLKVEVQHEGRWRRLGKPLEAGEPDGSFSHNGPAGRQVYRFGCRGDHSVILRSSGGVDTEMGAVRMISSDGFEEIARLDAENPEHEAWVRTDRMPQPMRVRFRHG